MAKRLGKFPGVAKSGSHDILEELAHIVELKIIEAIVFRKLQVWRANRRMENAYIQATVNSTFINRARSTKKVSNMVSLSNKIGDEEWETSVPDHGQTINPEDSICMRELLERIMSELKQRWPKQHQFAVQYFAGEIPDYQMSTPSYAAFKRRVLQIMQEVRQESE